MSEPIVYYLNAATEECVAEFSVNEAAIVGNSRTFPFMVSPTISEWLVNGKNEIAVQIKRVSEEAIARREVGAARAAVSLCRAEIGDFVEPGEEDALFGVDWLSPPSPEGIELPAFARMTGEVKHDFGLWAWEFADPLRDDSATRGAVAALVEDLHRSLSARRVEPFLERMALKFTEIARCYGKTREDMNREAREALPEIWQDATWAMAPFDPASMQLRLCCGGRVAEVRAGDGEAPLRQLDPIDGETWGLRLFVARINGVFTVVR